MTNQAIEKLKSKVEFTEKLAYDFRRDLATNMNEIEKHFGIKHE